MIGLDIRVKNEYSNYLYIILKGVNLLNYTWKINTNEILYKENGEIKEDFFKTPVLNGKEFVKCISKDSYYMIFADIKAYPLNSEITEIMTLEEFLKSDCEIALICSDSEFIEFYCKDKDILDKVYNNCIENNYKEIKYLSKEDASIRNIVV